MVKINKILYGIIALMSINIFCNQNTSFAQTPNFQATFENTIEPEIGTHFIEAKKGGVVDRISNPFPDGTNNSSHVLRSIIYQNDQNLIKNGRAEFSGQKMITNEKRMIYTFDIYIPSDFRNGLPDSYSMVMSQFKTIPCSKYGRDISEEYDFYDRICFGGGIFNDLRIEPDFIEYRLRAEPDCKKLPLFTPTGKWVSYVIETYWTNTNKGYSYIYENGTLIYSVSNIKTLMDGFIESTCNVFWSLGLYTKTLGKESLVIYLDNIYVYDGDKFSVHDICSKCSSNEDICRNLTLDAEIIDESNNQSNGLIDVTMSGGTEPYSFLWNEGYKTEDRNNLSEGVYALTVTDNNGCEKSDTWSILNTNIVDPTTNTSPVVQINSPEQGNSYSILQIDASQSYDPDGNTLSYNWAIPSGIDYSMDGISSIELFLPKVNEPTTYSISLEVSDGLSSVLETIPITIVPLTFKDNIIQINSANADNFEIPNYPINSIDNNTSTRWSSNGEGKNLFLSLTNTSKISHIGISFYNRTSSKALFDIYASNDSINWNSILTNQESCGFSDNLHIYPFPESDTSQAFKYIKITGNGNTANDWNSYSEVKLFGNSSPTGNIAPTIENASITISDDLGTGAEVTNITASDPNINQVISYQIISGNTNSAFSLDANGLIKVNNKDALITNDVINLEVRVTDNGYPALSSNGSILINIVHSNEFQPDSIIKININAESDLPDWNELYKTSNTLNNLIYTNGVSSSIGFELWNDWQSSGGGETSGNCFNSSVIKTYLYTSDNNIRKFTLNGLDNSKYYNIEFLCSRKSSASGDRGAAFFLYDKQDSIDAKGNTCELLKFNNIRPVNNIIEIGYRKRIQDSDGHVNAIIIHESKVSTNNNAPTADDKTASISDNFLKGSLVTKITASDPDAGQSLTYNITAGNTGAAFSIDNTGTIKVNNASALKTKDIFTLNVQVTDNGTPALSAKALVKITIEKPVNHAPVINNKETVISDMISNGSLVMNMTATEPDKSQSLNYKIVAGNTGDVFLIDNLGNILVKNNQLLVAFDVFHLTIQVNDNGVPSKSANALATITIDHVNRNSAPVFYKTSFYIIDTLSIGSIVGKVLAVDNENDLLSFSIINQDNDWFEINENTGEITLQQSINISEDTEVVLHIKVTDSGEGNLSSSEYFTIKIIHYEIGQDPNQNGNRAPVIILYYEDIAYSGKIKFIDASGTFDPEGDELSFKWLIPDNIEYDSDDSNILSFLAPQVYYPIKQKFTLEVRDGTNLVYRIFDITFAPYKPETPQIEVISVKSSNFDGTNHPINLLDNNPNTYWSATGINEWVSMEFSEQVSLSHLKIAFHDSEDKKAKFDIQVSNDNNYWIPIAENKESCGFSSFYHVVEFNKNLKSTDTYKFIKLVGKGNNLDQQNSIAELVVYGNISTSSNISFFEEGINIYPNPANKFLKVDVPEESVVRIIDLLGKTLFEKEIYQGINEFVLDLKPGTYLVQLMNKEKQFVSKKLIIE